MQGPHVIPFLFAVARFAGAALAWVFTCGAAVTTNAPRGGATRFEMPAIPIARAEHELGEILGCTMPTARAPRCTRFLEDAAVLPAGSGWIRRRRRRWAPARCRRRSPVPRRRERSLADTTRKLARAAVATWTRRSYGT
jgi:hypothetical protein